MKNSEQSSYEIALAEMSKAKPDIKRVLFLLNSSLTEGSPQAAYALGTWYLYGEHVDQDFAEAVKLFKQAANGKISNALYDLAVCYEKGEGTKRNLKLAAENYLRAALHGDKQAVFEVGRCYFYGTGFDQNRRMAKIWLDRAKDLGIYETEKMQPGSYKPMRY